MVEMKEQLHKRCTGCKFVKRLYIKDELGNLVLVFKCEKDKKNITYYPRTPYWCALNI